MLRVVLDTNVFVSSLLATEGTPAQLLNAWREGRYMLVTSPAVIAEVVEVQPAAAIHAHHCLDGFKLARTAHETRVPLEFDEHRFHRSFPGSGLAGPTR